MKEGQYKGLAEDISIPYRPFFSVIITTYNRAHLIRRALISILNQTERDWEAIVVDDESTDFTYLKILPFLESYNKIRYFRKIHSGEAMSKNAGINLSRGKYISFLDSDDEYDPLHLQLRKQILLDNPSTGLLYGGARIIGNQLVPDRFDSEKLVNLNECAIGGTFFIEHGVIARLEGFRNIMLGTDADLLDRALKSGVRIRKTEIQTYIYHHENEDSITNMMIRNTLESENAPDRYNKDTN